MNKSKKYFTQLGILLATTNTKLNSIYSLILNLLTISFPSIFKCLLLKELKPINKDYPNKVNSGNINE
ncbi:hypothetical protein [Poseidonibacter lekithochrous]|uniref:hypothetical protein n=1 Tax=Poseidonibacter lekithochrous TaxID=1904463 RepID=UPI0008FC6F5E|nr:hypothetical protein [Poseidonibacter lekithochrous]QKJ23201.1 hypothetical protein ALEK_1938 [Poseidonibacter lekithochrous]